MRSLNKNRYNRRGNKVGMWEYYWDNGNLWYKGSYKNGKKEGLWEYYYPSGELDELVKY